MRLGRGTGEPNAAVWSEGWVGSPTHALLRPGVAGELGPRQPLGSAVLSVIMGVAVGEWQSYSVVGPS